MERGRLSGLHGEGLPKLSLTFLQENSNCWQKKLFLRGPEFTQVYICPNVKQTIASQDYSVPVGPVCKQEKENCYTRIVQLGLYSPFS